MLFWSARRYKAPAVPITAAQFSYWTRGELTAQRTPKPELLVKKREDVQPKKVTGKGDNRSC